MSRADGERGPCGAAVAEDVDDPILDAEMVEDNQRMGLAERIVPAFAVAIRRGVAELSSALVDGDRAAAARLAHRLRGTSAQVGARRLSRVIGELEDQIEQGESVAVAPVVEAIASLTEATILALDATMITVRGR